MCRIAGPSLARRLQSERGPRAGPQAAPGPTGSRGSGCRYRRSERFPVEELREGVTDICNQKGRESTLTRIQWLRGNGQMQWLRGNGQMPGRCTGPSDASSP
jgi:hypothetical protein